MFSTSKDKIDELYASLQEYFNIDYDVDLKKCIEVELDHRPDGSIHIRQPCLTQSIINIIPVMDKSRNNPTPAVKPPLKK